MKIAQGISFGFKVLKVLVIIYLGVISTEKLCICLCPSYFFISHSWILNSLNPSLLSNFINIMRLWTVKYYRGVGFVVNIDNLIPVKKTEQLEERDLLPSTHQIASVLISRSSRKNIFPSIKAGEPIKEETVLNPMLNGRKSQAFHQFSFIMISGKIEYI